MLFSIVIPTRNRAETLPAAVQTCLDQSFTDYEIIISDNSDEPMAQDALAACSDSRIRIVRPPRLLSMSENWEFAFSNATGQYVFYMGDDDGLLPETLGTLARLIETYQSPAIAWRKADFVWPQGEPGTLELPTTYYGYRYHGAKALEQALSFRAGRPWLPYNRLPTLYNAVVSREALGRVVKSTGRLFWSSQPDIFSGIATASVIDEYIYLGFPFSINGGSKYSNGRAVDPKIKSEFLRLSADASNDACPNGLLVHSKSIASCVLEAAFYAHKVGLIQLPPYRRIIAAVRSDLMAAGIEFDEKYFRRLVEACGLAGSPARWRYSVKSARTGRTSSKPVGAVRGSLHFEPEKVGVHTVADAARFLNGLLPWEAIDSIDLRVGPNSMLRIASLAHRVFGRAVPDQHL